MYLKEDGKYFLKENIDENLNHIMEIRILF